MKRHFCIIILFFALGLFAPIKSFAHSTWNSTYWTGTVATTGTYLAFGWPFYSVASYRAAYNPTASMAYTYARNKVEYTYRIMAMGEGKKQVWLEEKMLPQPIIPSPIPPENLEAPDIVVNSQNEASR